MSKWQTGLVALTLTMGAYGCAATAKTDVATATPQKPNILFIMLDDLNADIGAYGGQAITPNIDKLAATGVKFENGYSVVPACNPSRVALLTGQRPETNGQYTNEGNFREKPGGGQRVTLPQWLKGQGYRTVAAGKIFHHPRGRGAEAAPVSDPQSWDEQAKVNTGTGGLEAFLDTDGWAKWLGGADSFGKLKIGDYIRKNGVWGPIDEPKEKTGDFEVARYCADFIKRQQSQPFMLACGLSRPHAPHIAPREFFDLYPIEKVQLPVSPDDDLNDVPRAGKVNWSSGFARKLRADRDEWRRAVQGYLASTSFADAAVGRILDALAESGRDEDTIVVLVGDHGFQMGQKDRWEKFTLWNLGGRTTMIMRVPGISPRHIKPAVSFLDIFPTLASLIGSQRPSFVEGADLTPLIRDPGTAWSKPAVQTYQQGNIGVRLGQWNYIRYRDGSEELYDLAKDPHELKNLISKGHGSHAKLVKELKNFMPEVTVPQADYKPMG